MGTAGTCTWGPDVLEPTSGRNVQFPYREEVFARGDLAEIPTMPAFSSLLIFSVLALEQSHGYASEAGTHTLRSDANSSSAVLLQSVAAVDSNHLKGPHTVHRKCDISSHQRSWYSSDFLFTSDGVHDPARLKLFVKQQLHPKSRARACTPISLAPTSRADSHPVACMIHPLDFTALAESFLLACSNDASPTRSSASSCPGVSPVCCLVGLNSCCQ